jgi:hypothetical protein
VSDTNTKRNISRQTTEKRKAKSVQFGPATMAYLENQATENNVSFSYLIADIVEKACNISEGDFKRQPRPRRTGKWFSVNLSLPSDIVSELDKCCEATKLSRSSVIHFGLRDFFGMDNTTNDNATNEG